VPRAGAVYETSEEGSGVAYGNRWWVIEQARGAPTMGETSEEGRWCGICKQVVRYRTGEGAPMVGAVYKASEERDWRGVWIEQARGAPMLGAVFETSEETEWRGLWKQVVGYRTGKGRAHDGRCLIRVRKGSGMAYANRWWVIEQAGAHPWWALFTRQVRQGSGMVYANRLWVGLSNRRGAVYETSEGRGWRGIRKQVVGDRTGEGRARMRGGEWESEVAVLHGKWWESGVLSARQVEMGVGCCMQTGGGWWNC
jgi:hypothetical protein